MCWIIGARKDDPLNAALRPALFLDRDGTLNRDLGYMHRPQDLEWIGGAIDAIRYANDKNWLVIVATNQSGIGRGYFDEAAVEAFHARMQEDLRAAGAHIDAFYFCPFHADAVIDAYRCADHPDRKPNPGMLKRAMAEWPIDPAHSVMVGDSARDLEAATAAGIRGVLYTGGSLLAVVRAAMEGN